MKKVVLLSLLFSFFINSSYAGEIKLPKNAECETKINCENSEGNELKNQDPLPKLHNKGFFLMNTVPPQQGQKYYSDPLIADPDVAKRRVIYKDTEQEAKEIQKEITTEKENNTYYEK